MTRRAWALVGGVFVVLAAGCSHEGPNPAECRDGLDNDRDGVADCDDPDCQEMKACEPVDDDCTIWCTPACGAGDTECRGTRLYRCVQEACFCTSFVLEDPCSVECAPECGDSGA